MSEKHGEEHGLPRKKRALSFRGWVQSSRKNLSNAKRFADGLRAKDDDGRHVAAL
jgi:hypothetical protein